MTLKPEADMDFPERFSNLPAYAFPRLRALLDGHAPGGEEILMTIGEPRHPFPDWVGEELAKHAAGFGKYPPNPGAPELLTAISGWIARRYGVTRDAETEIMALNGTREGLFNSLIALCPEEKRGKRPVVLIPNPFYQVYAVAALAIGAEPVFVPAPAESGYLPDFSALSSETLSRTAVAYICSPSNPQGAVASTDYWRDLFALAERYDFRVFADECYSEIYRDTPPPGSLEVIAATGTDPERLLAFHSLSKRSNVPGLRSGFVAGGSASIARLNQLRAYAGAPLPLPLQHVAARLWGDEDHVIANRALYAEKYALADEIFAGLDGYTSPQAGFFLWLPVEDGEVAAVRLWTETGVKVLPGAYLGRDGTDGNPGDGFIRVALVAPKDDTQRGLIQLRDCLYGAR